MDRRLWLLIFVVIAIVLIAPLTVDARSDGQPQIPHTLDGRADCLSCHASGLSASHTGKTNDTCTSCHTVASAASDATTTAAAGPDYGIVSIPHPVAGREQCLACHGPQGTLPVPADHAGRTNDVCQGCHQPGGTGSNSQPTAAATASQTSTAVAQSDNGIIKIPHGVTGREDCLSCHVSGSMIGVPADHAGRMNQTCLGCHGNGTAAAAASASQTPTSDVKAATAAVPPIPHSLDGRSNCVSCHGEGGTLPMPADHQGRTNSTCQSCHLLAAAAEPTASAQAETTVAAAAAETSSPTASATAAESGQEQMPKGGVQLPVILGAVAGMAIFFGGIVLKFRRGAM
ncbi:MAG: cytochrome c3 family protein [Chloroflexi bacterium]|nr:cytochrome c3 family protein [Chloroflexota bacterium]